MARASANRIRLEDQDVYPAKTEGPANVYSSTAFLLVKPRWMPDDEAHVCPLCSQKFNQIRRKHHCRQCGNVLCNKCCNEKVPLPQMGFEDPERVCDFCLPVTSLITKSRSPQLPFKLEAAKTLSEMFKEPASLKKKIAVLDFPCGIAHGKTFCQTVYCTKVPFSHPESCTLPPKATHYICIELGGVQTIIYLSQCNSEDVKAAVCDGLQTLSTHPPLHSMLAKYGAIKALCGDEKMWSTSSVSEKHTVRPVSEISITNASSDDLEVCLSFLHLVDGAKFILSSTNESHEKTLLDGISALMIFCKSEELKAQALADGALNPVLSLCAMKEAIALLAMMTLSHIVEHHGNLAPLIESDRNALPRILALTKANDEKIQEISLRILSQMSMGTDWQRHRIVQEDFSAGRCLVDSLRRGPKNLQVLVNASSLIANLALGEQDQMSLRDCLEAMCDVMTSHSEHKDIQIHVSRALANFSKFHQNSTILIGSLSQTIKIHLKSDNETIRCHGLRTVMNLLSQQKDQTVSQLMREGANEVLIALGSFPGIVDAIQTSLLHVVSPLTPP